MAVNTKAIKTRIKSVRNTQKMTKAMEMVSAAKMRKATEATLNTRMYADLARGIMESLADFDDPTYRLLQLRPVENILIVLVSSNRGLCGSYNANIFKTVSTLLKDPAAVARHRVADDREAPEPATKDPKIHVIGIGKRSASFAKKQGYALDAVFDDLGEKPGFDDIRPIAKMIIDAYLDGTYDKIAVAYTSFQSTLSQEVKVRQVLPVSTRDLAKMTPPSEEADATNKMGIETYLFEPGTDAIVEQVLPKLVEIQLYQAVLDASASEHSSRMIAMKNASDNAGEMVKDLTRTYNKARQAAITQEISEIVGGAAALE